MKNPISKNKLNNAMKYQFSLALLLIPFILFSQNDLPDNRRQALKDEAVQKIDDRAKLAQVMVDKVFSFAELGFQEKETSKYLTDILAENGFEITHGISGVPTAWLAKWGRNILIHL